MDFTKCRIVILRHPYSMGAFYTLTNQPWSTPDSPRNPVDNLLAYDNARFTTPEARNYGAPRLPPNPWKAIGTEHKIWHRMNLADWLPLMPREWCDLPIEELFPLREDDPRCRMPRKFANQETMLKIYHAELDQLKAMIPADLPTDDELRERISTTRLVGLREIVRKFSAFPAKYTSSLLVARKSLWAILDAQRVLGYWVRKEPIPV